MLVLNLLAKDGDYEQAASRIVDLIQMLDRFEPRNHSLYHEMSLAFARLVSLWMICLGFEMDRYMYMYVL